MLWDTNCVLGTLSAGFFYRRKSVKRQKTRHTKRKHYKSWTRLHTLGKAFRDAAIIHNSEWTCEDFLVLTLPSQRPLYSRPEWNTASARDVGAVAPTAPPAGRYSSISSQSHKSSRNTYTAVLRRLDYWYVALFTIYRRVLWACRWLGVSTSTQACCCRVATGAAAVRLPAQRNRK